MITVLSALLGFLGSMLPEAVSLLKDRADRKHELDILTLQIEQRKQGLNERLEEVRTLADLSASRALYKTYATGISWVDALNGTVRPVIAYAFFLLYAAMKFMQWEHGLPWQLWNQEDQAIFAGIISFYYGQRAFGKLRK